MCLCSSWSCHLPLSTPSQSLPSHCKFRPRVVHKSCNLLSSSFCACPHLIPTVKKAYDRLQVMESTIPQYGTLSPRHRTKGPVDNLQMTEWFTRNKHEQPVIRAPSFTLAPPRSLQSPQSVAFPPFVPQFRLPLTAIESFRK